MHDRVVITGGSGFLGTAIAELLLARGCTVISLDVAPPKNKQVLFVQGDISKEIPRDPLLERPTAVINLAGVPIFGRWTSERMQAIYDSRVVGTKNLVARFAEEVYRPKYFVSASAVGFYGNRGEEVLTETSRSGDGFLAGVSRDWETEARRAETYGAATTIIRNGHILGKGGLLGVLAPFYKYGLGGPIGSGKQYMPWIHIHDCAALYVRAACGESSVPIMLATSTEQVTNNMFSQAIARTLKRPHVFFIPIWFLGIMYGGLGKEMATSQRVEAVLGGYVPRFSVLKDALADIL